MELTDLKVSRRTLLAGSALGVASVGGLGTRSYALDDAVDRWIARNAEPLGDFSQLRWSMSGAQIVGLGEAVHGTAELTRLKLRVVRYLVEHLGFRAIAFEDDWSLGTQLNSYVLTGRGDLEALMNQLSREARSQDNAELFEYLRRYNATHQDKVRFAGAEYFSTRMLSYDAVDEYVARRTPGQLAELRRSLNPIRPNRADMGEYLQWYWLEVKDKAPYVAKARAVHALIESLPHRPNDRDHAITLHHARQILSFYEAFSLPETEIPVYRDARAAENVRWWQSFTRSKTIYWAASAHVANAPGLRVTAPPGPDTVFPSVGSYLHDWYGARYRPVSFTFDHGTAGGPITLPAAAPDWFEHRLTAARPDQFTLDLRRRPQSTAVRTWLNAQAKTRGFPDAGPASTMTGNTLAEWFDVIVYTREVTPVTPL